MKKVFVYRNKNKKNRYTIIDLDKKRKICDIDSVYLLNAIRYTHNKIPGFSGLLVEKVTQEVVKSVDYLTESDYRIYTLNGNELTATKATYYNEIYPDRNMRILLGKVVYAMNDYYEDYEINSIETDERPGIDQDDYYDDEDNNYDWEYL